MERDFGGVEFSGIASVNLVLSHIKDTTARSSATTIQFILKWTDRGSITTRPHRPKNMQEEHADEDRPDTVPALRKDRLTGTQ